MDSFLYISFFKVNFYTQAHLMYSITIVYENIKMMRKVADMNFKDLSPKYPPPLPVTF